MTVRSKRIYSEVKCANEECSYEGVFKPHDKRQVFCCTQCRINHSNDQRNKLNSTVYSDEKKLRTIDKKLEKLYNAAFDGTSSKLHKAFFEYESIDLNLIVRQQIRKDNNQHIHWFYRYGLELSPIQDIIIIHKKPSA